MKSTRFESVASIGPKLIKKGAIACTSLMLMLCVVLNPGCSGNFLGLEDYQRDLLFGIGSLAFGLVNPNDGGDVGPAGPQGEPGPQGVAGQGEPGATGAQGESGANGQNCWDLNGDGVADVATEDINGDEVVDVLDCQGADGEEGLDGEDGFDGEEGISCWDLNEDGFPDDFEDINGDGVVDTLDCQGQAGEDGLDGEDGQDGEQGAPGPTLFDIYIDDFFTVEGGSYGALDLDPGDGLPIVGIREPALGVCQPNPENVSVVGYRVAMGERYHGGPVTMRLFVWREGPEPENCFVFRLDAFRARHGTGISQYGAPRFVRPEIPALPEADLQAGILLVIDLPLNTSNGLNFPDDLEIADLLAFELNTLGDWQDGGCYTLLGADFFESESSAAIQNAVVFESEDGIECTFCQNCCTDDDDCGCGEECVDGVCEMLGDDCDGNGTPDECEEFVCPDGNPLHAQGNMDGQTGGTVFLSGDDADDDNHCHGTLCAGLWPDMLEFAVDYSYTGPGGDGLICAVGANSGPALVALQGADGNSGWNNTGDPDHPGPGAAIEHFRINADIETFDVSACTVLYIASGSTQTPGGLTPSQLAALNTRQDDIVNFVNVQGGALVALTQAEMPGAYGWLPLEIQTADEEHFEAIVTQAMQDMFPGITGDDVSRPPGDAAPRYHTIFTGPEGYLGLEVLIREDDDDASDGAPLLLGGYQVIIGGQLTLSPDSATNYLPQDDSHTVTATLTDLQSDPIAGATIDFEIIEGPNLGLTGQGVTDANGEVSFTYTSDGTPSLTPDVIIARWDAGGEEDAVQKIWLPCHCEDVEPELCEDDSDCDDGLYCTGVETCNLSTGACESSGDPCDVGETCNESTDSCDANVGCTDDTDCDDGVFCNGTETCDRTDPDNGVCVEGPDPCAAEETCDEDNDECVASADCEDDGDCDDGAFCNGAETCDLENGTCLEGTDPCEAGETCDEDNDVCIPPVDPEGACCDGETCSVTIEAECAGVYQGDDSDCDPNPCVEAESDCCIPHNTPGCEDEACETAVCDQDPFCCNPVAHWDIICVNQAVELCGDLCDSIVGPVNDDYADSIDIFDGESEFDTTSASTDGLAHSDELCQFDGQTYNDIWYEYFATCTGELTVTTCEDLGGSADYDSDLVVYDGCGTSLPGDELVLGCNDDDPVNACGVNDFQSTVIVPVVNDNCYKIRIGGFKGGDSGTGTLLIACED